MGLETWDALRDDIRYIKERLNEKGHKDFKWSAGEVYKDEHILNMDWIAIRAITKKKYEKGDLRIIQHIRREDIKDSDMVMIVNEVALETLKCELEAL